MEERHEIIRFSNDIPIKIFLHRLGNAARHWHQSLELLMIVSGTVTVIIEDKRYELEKDDLILVNSNCTHELHSDDAVLVAVQMKLSKFELGDIAPEDYYFECNSKLDNAAPRFTQLKRIVANMIKHNSVANLANSFQNKSYAYALLAELVRNFKTDKERGTINTQKHLNRLSHILDYINANYREQLTLTGIAEHENLSVPYLSSFFEKYMGRNFLQYYTDFRLERAVNELVSSDESVENIAINNGFSNPRGFVRAFKKKYDMLPSVYRKQEQPSPTERSGDRSGLINYLEFDQQNYLATLAGYLSGEKEASVPAAFPSQTLRVNTIAYGQTEKKLCHTYKNFLCVGRAKEILLGDVQAMIIRAQKEIGFKYIKFHGIFSDDMMVVRRDAQGNLSVSFVMIDKVLDFLLSIGLKPLLQFSFMPEALASNKDKTVFSSKVNTSPPKDISQWNSLVDGFIRHLLGRYGREEVAKWLFSVWNEPDTSPQMFGFDSEEEYYNLYQQTYKTVKAVDPACTFGSPSLLPVLPVGVAWFERFLNFTIKNHIEPEFINLHYYSDEFEARTNYGADRAFITNASLSTDAERFSKYISKVKTVLQDLKLGGLPVYITEWNLTASHRSLINDTCFKSCYYAKNVLENYDRLDSFGYWMLTDLIEEIQPSNKEFHGGMGLFTQSGIPKPTYYVMSLFTRLGSKLVAAGNGYFITRHTNGDMTLICYNYEHFDDLFAAGELFDMTERDRYTAFSNTDALDISIPIKDIPYNTAVITEYYVNRRHGSCFDKWVECSTLELHRPEDLAQLSRLSAPGMNHYQAAVADGELTYCCSLEPLEVRMASIRFASC